MFNQYNVSSTVINGFFFFAMRMGLMMDIFLSEIFFFMRFKYLSRVLSNIITRNIVDNIA